MSAPSWRPWRLGGSSFLMVMVAAAVILPVSAQISPDQIRQRYEKNTKGSDLKDYVRKFNSEDADKRLEGVKLIGESKDEKAFEYLVQALGDPDVRVKAKAIDTLGNIRAAEATPVLIQHLFLRSTEPTVKRRILASLGKIGDPRAAAPIAEFLKRDLDPATRGTAIFALGEIGSPDSLTALDAIVNTEPDNTLRRLASEAGAKVRYHQANLKNEAKEPRSTFLEAPQQPPEQ